MNLDPVFRALSDPTRRALVQRLATGEATVGELAAPFEISQPAISHHLKVLAEAGLVVMVRSGRRTVCRLQPEPLRQARAWMRDCEAFWEGRVARLQSMLAETKAAATMHQAEETS